MKRTITILLLCVAALSLTAGANAASVNVSFIDSDGPQWQGAVDTTLDILIIDTWVEGSGGDYEFWTPSTPLVFSALHYASNGNFISGTPYDVPDDWNGTIGSNWGFLSQLTKQQIQWNEGTFTQNPGRLGWGIAHFGGPVQTDVFNDESWFSFVPYSGTHNRAVQADRVTVGTAVPEIDAGQLGTGLALLLSLILPVGKANA